MIKRRKVKPRLRRAIWARITIDPLRCPMCLGKGSVWRDANGHFSQLPQNCTICLGKGIPPIPFSELSNEA